MLRRKPKKPLLCNGMRPFSEMERVIHGLASELESRPAFVE